MRFDRAMSDAEALMWRLEQDPYLSSTFGAVMVLDRAPDLERFKRRLDRTSHIIRRLRQRVQGTPAGLPPVWVDDIGFDIDYHVRRIACPTPATLRQALDVASLIVADPLDRTRPLWQYVVIEGLRGGKAAVVQKMHHTLTDGERGVQLSLQYLDLERDPPDPPPLVRASDGDQADDPLASQTAFETAREIVAGGLRLPIGVVRQVRDLLADPGSIPDAAAAAARTLRSIVTQLGDTSAARSPLWTARSLHRRVEPLQAPFEATKSAATSLGGTLNTALLTVAAHAAGHYHAIVGAPVDALRASMAVSTRTEQSGSNAFTLVRLVVPTAEMPIVERFHLVQHAIGEARESSPTGGLDALAVLTTALPTSVITRVARQHTQTVDFATSNLRGSPIPLYLAGARVLEVYPIGPLLGVAFNLTLMSYLESLDVALNIDTAAVAEPELLRRSFDDAFQQLVGAA